MQTAECVLLDVLIANGYKSERILYRYASVIILFAVVYAIRGKLFAAQQEWYDALIVGVRNFHGRASLLNNLTQVNCRRFS
jgi:hypothetical protein